jgi:hypothetical protein
MNAGAASVDITPTSPCHLAGYAQRDHGHESVHDPLSLRALYVSSGQDEALLITADVIWITEDVIERVAPVISDQLGLNGQNVMFAGSHTHSAPNPRNREHNRDWIQRLEDQVVSAAALAKSRSAPVTIQSARGNSDIGVNRRELLPDGRITLGINPAGPCDRELILTSFATDSDTIATIGNFACHGTTLSQRNYELSGDWSGVASIAIESAKESGSFLFLNGGAANICPRIDRQESFDPVEKFASEFKQDFDKTARSLALTSGEDSVSRAERTILLPRKVRDIEDGKGRFAKVLIQGLRIGPLHILAFPGEVFSQTATAVKSAHPDTLVMVCSYASGGRAGYVPVREAYDTGGYEVRVSPYSQDAEDILRSEFLALLGDLG